MRPEHSRAHSLCVFHRADAATNQSHRRQGRKHTCRLRRASNQRKWVLSCPELERISIAHSRPDCYPRADPHHIIICIAHSRLDCLPHAHPDLIIFCSAQSRLDCLPNIFPSHQNLCGIFWSWPPTPTACRLSFLERKNSKWNSYHLRLRSLCHCTNNP